MMTETSNCCFILLYLSWTKRSVILICIMPTNQRFQWTLCLPYGWQAKGETIGIVPQGNRKTNVFGIFSAANRCLASYSAGNINGAFVVNAIEQFCQQLALDKPSVLVLDNAEMHHSRLVQSKLTAWQEKGLYLFYLPTYSPHLNLAETFWRKAKYEWMKPADYIPFERFKEKITDIFTNIGSKYSINFKELECHNNSAWLLNCVIR